MDKLVTVGASAGGVPALLELAAALPHDFPAPILVVLHIGTHRSILPQLLARATRLDVAHGRHGERLQPGRIRIAPPDHHMLVAGDTIALNRGPKEHHSRPAIDPLFRSAALSRRSSTIGVVLTGMLDDGTAGLQAIKECGGLAVVQDPTDAIEPSMPASALTHVDVDYCLALPMLPMLLTSLASSTVNGAAGASMPPPQAEHEQQLFLGHGDAMEHLAAIGKPSPFVCPECHGGLWSIEGTTPKRFRCHTGHAFTERTLENALAVAGDEAGWNALRALQERRSFVSQMLQQHTANQQADEVARLSIALESLDRQIEMLRPLLVAPVSSVD
jgi:two-component system chemotaxis response regulator CheB